jgi:hypothetical protein
MVNGKRHNIGFFKDIEDARISLEKFRLEHHVEFARNK